MKNSVLHTYIEAYTAVNAGESIVVDIEKSHDTLTLKMIWMICAVRSVDKTSCCLQDEIIVK